MATDTAIPLAPGVPRPRISRSFPPDYVSEKGCESPLHYKHHDTRSITTFTEVNLTLLKPGRRCALQFVTEQHRSSHASDHGDRLKKTIRAPIFGVEVAFSVLLC
jgi:hypothetical protein